MAIQLRMRPLQKGSFCPCVVGKCSFISHKLRFAAELKNKNRYFCTRSQVMQNYQEYRIILRVDFYAADNTSAPPSFCLVQLVKQIATLGFPRSAFA